MEQNKYPHILLLFIYLFLLHLILVITEGKRQMFRFDIKRERLDLINQILT